MVVGSGGGEVAGAELCVGFRLFCSAFRCSFSRNAEWPGIGRTALARPISSKPRVLSDTHVIRENRMKHNKLASRCPSVVAV